MRSSTSTASEEKLKNDYRAAKKATKKAKAAYKAKLKDFKAKTAPLKQALKEAKAAEKQAKAAYKSANGNGQSTTAPMETSAPKKRGRQPGYSPKAAREAAAIAAPVKATPSKGGNDDLTKVKGVGENISVMLKANGISSFADMAATSFERYKELLKANGMSKFRDPSQWAARAAELANMPAPTATSAPKAAATEPTEPKKRGRQPGYSPKAAREAAAVTAPVKATPSKGGSDDLTKVKGVGENISVMLKANGISSFADMAATSFERYKELLKANGMSKFRDPSQWAARAAELANMPAPTATSAPKAAATEPTEPKKRGRQPGYSPKAAKEAAVVNHEEQKAPTARAAASTGGDDLTKVKGVGDNIAVMLKANGILTYSDMAGTSFERYKELLKANGMSKFRDPSQWAARAAELSSVPAEPSAEPKKRGRQPGFSPKTTAAKPATTASNDNAAPKKRGRQPGYSPKAAKAGAETIIAAAPVPATAPTKAPAKPKGPPAKPDDLTQVKGVGQRVADALNKEGIYTYRDMADVSLEQYKAILKDNNMSKFRDPSDWARIAGELAGKK